MNELEYLAKVMNMVAGSLRAPGRKVATFHLLNGEVREVAFDPSIPCVLCGKPREKAPTSYLSFRRGLCLSCDEKPLTNQSA